MRLAVKAHPTWLCSQHNENSAQMRLEGGGSTGEGGGGGRGFDLWLVFEVLHI